MADPQFIDADNPKALQLAADTLNRGGVIVFRTDTVYGLLAAVTDQAAYNRIFQIKQRAAGSPVAVLAHHRSAAASEAKKHLSGNPEQASMFAAGELTVVFVQDVISSLPPTIPRTQPAPVGLRLPADPATRALLEAAGGYAWATSANRAGGSLCTDETEIRDWLAGCGALPDLVVVAADQCTGRPSKIARLDDGAISWIRQ